MYKLVIVAGKLRGKEFNLNDGENFCGRDESCTVHLPVEGISKKHMSITVSADAAYLQDLGSSNGTFLNGKIIKRATIKSGDKIALPDTIIQIVEVKEKKIIIKKRAAEEEDKEEDFDKIPPAPKELPKKLIWLFQHKMMPMVHGINKEYEWRALLGILLALFIVLIISSTIFPVLRDSRSILLLETVKRVEHFADEIARMNARALEQKELDRVDSNFLEKEADVVSYELFDLEGRIVRPAAKLNDYISDTFSVQSRDWAVQTASKTTEAYRKLLNDGEIGVAQKIMAYNNRTGILEAVGVIAIRFAPRSLAIEATNNMKSYLEALVTSALFAVFFYGIFYYLTIKPIDEIRFQIEEAIRGKRRNVESVYLVTELAPLRSTINSLLQRVRELSKEDTGDFDEVEDAGPYLNSLIEFMNGATSAAMILDFDKNIYRINTEGEDVTGIRQSGSEGMSLLDVAREQGFAATVIELCDKSASNAGTSQKGNYELQGHDYIISICALMGKDGFAKGFYLTFKKND